MWQENWTCKNCNYLKKLHKQEETEVDTFICMKHLTIMPTEILVNNYSCCDFVGTLIDMTNERREGICNSREKMSKEEAIWRIQDHRRIHSKKEPFTPKLDEAFDMAIEALKRI